MNNVDIFNVNRIHMHSDLWINVFDKLSEKKVFLVFARINKECAELVKKYYEHFQIQEKYWEKRCIEEQHASWDGKKLTEITKKPFLTWRQAYIASDLTYYLSKKCKYTPEKIIHIDLHEKEKAKRFMIKHLKNSNYIEKVLIRAIGKNKFDQISILAECLKGREMVLLDDIDFLQKFYRREEFNFPSVVRGKTKFLKFLFLRLHYKEDINLKKNQLCYFYIDSHNCSDENCTSNKFNFKIDVESTFMNGNPLSSSAIEMLHDIFLKGFYEKLGSGVRFNLEGYAT